MPKKSEKTAQFGLELLAKRIEATEAKLLKAVAKWRLTEEESSRISALFGIAGRCEKLHASDLPGRSEAARILTELLVDMESRFPQRRFYLFSFTDDVGNTLDRAPLMRVKALKDKASTTLRATKLPCIAVMGIHPFVNYPAKGNGRQMSLDIHAFAWSDDVWDYEAAQKRLNDSRAWYSSLTPKPVDIRRIKAGTLETVASYLFKPWHAAKNVVPHPKKEGRLKLLDTTAGYRPEQCLRVVEAYSQLRLDDLIFGVNGGRGLRQTLRAGLRRWQKARSEPEVMDGQSDIWRMWLELRREHGSKRYLPFRFDMAGTDPARPPKRRPRTLRRRPRQLSSLGGRRSPPFGGRWGPKRRRSTPTVT